MRSVITMAMKDLVLITRDLLGLFFIIGFPVLMGVFFGAMYSGIGESEGGAELEVAVVDGDKSATSKKFVELLDAGNVKALELSREEATGRVRRGDLVGLIVIPPGFGKTAGIPWEQSPAIELGVDPSRKAEAAMLHGLILEAVGKLTAERLKPALSAIGEFFGVGGESESADAKPGKGGDATSEWKFQLARIETVDVTHQPAPGSVEALVRNIRSKWDISFPQAMIWGVLGCAAAFAVTIVRERKQGTLLRLNAAPVSQAQIILGKALACFLTVLVVIAMMVALGWFLGMRPRSPGLLAVASVCVASAFVGIAILMSVIGKTEEAVGGAAWGLNSLMAMFGGGMIPLAFMPKFMATMSHASPVKWSVLSLEGAIWRGFTPSEMVLPCVILLSIGAVSLALGTFKLSRMVD